MMTIEQALAATPGGFKLTSFDGPDEHTTYTDRNGNKVMSLRELWCAIYNGETSPRFDTINEACTWMENKKKWWKS